MLLHLLSAPRQSPQVFGAPDGSLGVGTDSGCGVAPRPEPASRMRRRGGWRAVAIILALAFCLLGQGEECRVDARFASPSSTLETYWGAMRANDEVTLRECLSEGREDTPFPGMLWFMPPTPRLWLAGFRSLPVTAGRVIVTYDVCFTIPGLVESQSFHTGSELVRERGEWRIVRPLGRASVPQWNSVARPIDS